MQHQPKLESSAKLLEAIVSSWMERNIKAYWEISDENGQVVKGECKSFLKNFAYVFQAFFNATNPTLKDLTNTNRITGIYNHPSYANIQGLVSGAGTLTSGTGIGAINSDDYSMGTVYQTTGVALLTTDIDTADQFRFSLYQSIVATSTTTITEMGFIAKFNDTGIVSRDILIIRDLINPSNPPAGFATTIGVAYIMKVTIDFTTGANSYLTQLAKMWRGIMAGQNETLTDKTGATFVCPILSKANSSLLGIVNAPATIQFGDGATAPTMDDFKLVNQVAGTVAVANTLLNNDTTRLKWENYQSVAFGASYTLAEMSIELKTFDNVIASKNLTVARCLISPTIAVVAGEGVMGKFTHDIAI